MPVRGCPLALSLGAWLLGNTTSPWVGAAAAGTEGRGPIFTQRAQGVQQPFLQPALQLAGGTRSERGLCCAALAELGSIYTSLIQPRPTPGRSSWNGNILPLSLEKWLVATTLHCWCCNFSQACQTKSGGNGHRVFFTSLPAMKSFCLCQPRITPHSTLERHNYARKVCCVGLRGKMWFHFITLEFSH